jgi:ABC-type dipeptide/oligopeptide/nickel transport system ATPase subunit
LASFGREYSGKEEREEMREKIEEGEGLGVAGPSGCGGKSGRAEERTLI